MGDQTTKPQPLIMVVDDDESVRTYLLEFIASSGYQGVAAGSGQEALDLLKSGQAPELIVLDVMMPKMDGIETLSRIRDLGDIPVLMLSAVGQAKIVVQAMKLGVVDYLTKPFEDDDLELALDRVFETRRLRQDVAQLRQELEGHADELVCINPKMIHIRDLIRQIADTDATVLICGESGVGKELVAKAVHRHSHRADRRFVRVNCAALPAELLESELFGYEKGAFTGALREKPGKFELADRGTIFLDEIGEMSPHLQAKLLHVLQSGEFSKLGGKREIKVDARVVAATNKNLEHAIADGTFREDLYYRLYVVKIDVPPLRQRKEEIPVLCEVFLKQFLSQYRRTEPSCIPERLKTLLMDYHWPGNVRELENMMRRWVILQDEKYLIAELTQRALDTESAPQASQTEPVSLKEARRQRSAEVERDMILKELLANHWSIKKTAEHLKVSYRGLQYKIKEYGLNALK
jgi:two-component system response regulator AtoC